METHDIGSGNAKGILFVIGGHEDKAKDIPRPEAHDEPMEVLTTFLELTGKKDPCIEVITTAASDGQDTFSECQRAFASLGVHCLGHIHHDLRQEALGTALNERLQQADAFFFTGGDQLKLTSLYGGTPFLETLKMRFVREAVVIAGTSAGAMAFSTPMIFAGSKEKQQIAGEVRLTTGLEFLKDVCIDTHFVDRSRFVRMAQVIATNPACIGIGIEENTGIIVRRGKEVTVTGKGVVIVVEGFGITGSNILEYGADKTITIRDLNVKLLGRGEMYRVPVVGPEY